MGWKKRIIAGVVRYLKGKKISKKRAVIILVFCYLFAYFAGVAESVIIKVCRKKKLAVRAVMVLGLVVLFPTYFFISEKVIEENRFVGTHLHMRDAWEDELFNSAEVLDRGNKISQVDSFLYYPGNNPYMIKVNRLMNCVTIYTYDNDGKYTTPVKTMVCSTGREGRETPLGVFRMGDKHEWCLMVDNSWGQYAYRISGPIMFHSVPYYERTKDSLEYEEYNKLGEGASLGCIRLSVEDSKWLYDHCERNTIVEIYDDPDPGPLGKPDPVTIPYGTGWDPTDPDENNPFRN